MLVKTKKVYSINRKNNDGNYEKNNIEWATPYEQARNRTNSYVTLKNALILARIYCYYKIKPSECLELYNETLVPRNGGKKVGRFQYHNITNAANTYGELMK